MEKFNNIVTVLIIAGSIYVFGLLGIILAAALIVLFKNLTGGKSE